MNLNITRVKIIVTIPRQATEKVRVAVCEVGAGIIGNYTHCSTTTKCLETYKPNEVANPYFGTKNKLEFIEEDKLEVVCPVDKVSQVIKRLREVHPYEEPDINIVPLLDEKNFE